MRFLLLMIMSVNLVFSAPADVCSAGKKQTSFGEISKLISVTSTISNELGGFVDPGPPDVFQVYDFCDQISEEKNAFGYDTEEIFIKYLSEKILGIKSGYAGKVVSDEPYNGYLRKYLHHFQCDTRELTPFSMREKNSFFKHIVDLGRPDYFNKFYFARCVPDNSKPGLNVNQYEIIDGKKETLLDFVHKVTTFRVNDPTRMNQSQEDLRKLSRELIDNCGAKKGSEL